MNILANPDQKLEDHLINVAELSSKIIEKLEFKEDNDDEISLIFNKEKLIKIAYFAGLFHDIGKTDPIFQKYILDKTTTNYNPNGVHIEKNSKDEKFSFEDHPRHSEISWAILEIFFNHKNFKMNKSEFDILKNIVLWHHSAPLRKSDFKLNNIIKPLKNKYKEFKENLFYISEKLKNRNKFKELDLSVDEEYFDDFFQPTDKEISRYKYFYSINSTKKDLSEIKQDIASEAAASLLRSVVITADRHISANRKNINMDKILEDIFEENKYSKLQISIDKMEKTFFPDSEQSLLQKETALKLNEKNGINILVAPAGAGKTKTSLQWAKYSNANKIYYIVPRTIIGEEIYDELITKYLKKDVSIEIITGDKKLKWDGKKEIDLSDDSCKYSSDIVITTIDQIIKSMTTHKDISVLFDMINSHIIFDEYHEYNKLSGLDVLFAECLKIKSIFKKSNTLIMSATPNYFMLEKFLEIYNPRSSKNNIVKLKTLNDKDFNIKFMEYDENDAIPEDTSLFIRNGNGDLSLSINNDINRVTLNENPFFKLWDDKKTIVISNTATMAQVSYLVNYKNEESMLAHSKYEKNDKKNILSEIKSNFKNINNGFKTLRAGPIVQASLNITSERLVTDIASAEDIIQRLGRLNRFSDFFIGEFVIAVPTQIFNNDSKSSGVLNLLSRNNSLDTSIKWLKFIKDKMNINESGTFFKLNQIYDLYEEFYKDIDVQKSMELELLKSLEKSYKNIGYNVLDPVEIINKNKKKSDIQKLSKFSLRGKSYFSKMAVYKLGENSLELTDNYKEKITLNKDIILLYNKNYIFVRNTIKKLSTLMSDTKIDTKISKAIKAAKDGQIDDMCKKVLNLAISEDFNIYTSISKKDLSKFNVKTNEPESIVYVTSEKQSIGYINLKKLIK